MNIVLSKKQLEIIESIRETEKKKIILRRDPKKIYKWLPGAFVNDIVTLYIKNGEIVNASYLGVDLGVVFLARSTKEARFRIVNIKALELLLQNTKEFTLVINNCHCIDQGWFVKAYNLQGQLLVDLTVSNTMSLDIG